MDITLKIHQGTGRLTGEGLCTTCCFGLLRATKNKEEVFCTYAGSFGPSHQVHGRIQHCNQYTNRALPSLHEMREVAWTLNTNKGGRSVGFNPPHRRDDDGPVQAGF